MLPMSMSASYSYPCHAKLTDGSINTSSGQANYCAQDGWNIEPSVILCTWLIYHMELVDARLYITMAAPLLLKQAAGIYHISEISNPQRNKLAGRSCINIAQWYPSLKSNPQTLLSRLHSLQV